jgi:hypothetical protein
MRYLLVSLLFLLGGAAHAQSDDLPETLPFEDSVVVQYPTGWEVTTLDDGRQRLTSQDSIVDFFPPDLLVERYDIDPDEGFIDLLLQFFPNWDYTEGVAFDADAVTRVTLDGREAATYDFTDAFGDEALLVAVTFRDGRRGVVVGLTFGGALTERETILEIAATFDLERPQTDLDEKSGSLENALDGISPELPPGWELITFFDDTRIGYDPALWDVNRMEPEIVNLRTDDQSLIVIIYSADTLAEANANTPADVLAYDLRNVETADFDPARVEPITVAGVDGVTDVYQLETAEGVPFDMRMIALPVAQGNYLVAAIVPTQQAELPDLTESFAVLDTLVTTETAQSTGAELATADTPLSQSYTLELTSAVLEISLPESWQVDDDGSPILFLSEYTSYLPGWIAPDEQANFDIQDGDLVQALRAFFQPSDPELTFRLENVKIQAVGDETVARYDYLDSDGESAVTVTLLARLDANGWILLASYLPRTDDQIMEADAALNVFFSTTVTPQ